MKAGFDSAGSQATMLNVDSKMVSVPVHDKKATCKAFQVGLFHQLVFSKLPPHLSTLKVINKLESLKNTIWLL